MFAYGMRGGGHEHGGTYRAMENGAKKGGIDEPVGSDKRGTFPS